MEGVADHGTGAGMFADIVCMESVMISRITDTACRHPLRSQLAAGQGVVGELLCGTKRTLSARLFVATVYSFRYRIADARLRIGKPSFA